MRLDRIYTKVGDKGKTMLADGSKVEKSNHRLEAYGDIDELNAVMGILADNLVSNEKLNSFVAQIRWIQNRLFDIGGELATPKEKLDISIQQVVKSEDVSKLEELIDEMNQSLEPLKNFVLPGGAQANSYAHLARCVCRRAERKIVKFDLETENVRSELKIFVNRLSDWLFVLSRKVCQVLNVEEVIWSQSQKS